MRCHGKRQFSANSSAASSLARSLRRHRLRRSRRSVGQNRHHPAAVVGDLDSLPPRFRERYADRIHIVEDQEINDLTKSVRFAHRSGQQEVLILGATGLREDHTLGNISLLMDYAPLFRRIEMLSDYGLFTPIRQTTTLTSKPGTQVSLFSLAPSGTISTTGLRWPIRNRRLTAWWQGALNEATGNSFTVTLSPEARVIVYRTL